MEVLYGGTAKQGRHATFCSWIQLTTSDGQINHLTFYAQLQQRNQGDLARYQHALETLLTAEIEANTLIEDLKAALEKLNSQPPKPSPPEKDTSDSNTEGKGKERESSPDSQMGEDDETGKRSGIANRLREAELLLHKVTFLMGDVYHTLGVKYSKEEESAYAKAELVRRRLLKGNHISLFDHSMLIPRL